AARRLWLCQYGSTPSWPTATWPKYWLWQFTDGVYGPEPHGIDGIGPCDINSYAGKSDQLVAEWASGKAITPRPPAPPSLEVVTIRVAAPTGVDIKIRQVGSGTGMSRNAFTASHKNEVSE